MILANQGIYQGVIEAGLRLSETPESEGGFREFFEETEIVDMRIPDDYLRACTALLMENSKRWMAQVARARKDSNGNFVIDETTRAALVGGWSDYLFPIIRASFPSNPVNELVSVQPTTRRVATVVYWDWIVGRGKGRYSKGSKLFDANVGKQDSGFNFSNEVVEKEAIAALGAPGATVSGTLEFSSGGGVRPATVKLTLTTTADGALVFVDNGNGGFIIPAGATGTVASSSINYVSGAWSITLAGDTFTTATTNRATYRWDSEGSSDLAQVDVKITTSTVETERRALRVNYTLEASQDVFAEFGVSLEPQLVQGAAEQLNFEIARQIISEIWSVAPVASTFAITGPIEYSQQEHFRDFIYNLRAADNSIWRRTQKGYGNWLVVDEGAANLIESLPGGMFVPAPRPANVQGVHFIGTLMNRYRVYKDIHLDKEPGATADGNILMGFKGSNFWEAGFVYSPYQLLYTTDTTVLADMVAQKGMATRYATKMVNKDMYARISLLP
jgi:hypothetical protein